MKKMKRNQLFTLLFILAASIIGLGLYLLFSFPDNTLIIFVLVIGVIFFIILLILLVVLKTKREHQKKKPPVFAQNMQEAFDAYNQRLQQALEIAEKKKEDLSALALNSVEKYLGKLEKNDICMVCKLILNEKDDILQCPVCESLYHKDHLMEWIKVKNTCPVCSQNLKKKQEEK
jgi:hypothetical protein